MRSIYLDNHTVTRPFPEVVSAMLPFLVEKWGVPSAPHAFGQSLYTDLEKGYADLYSLVDASNDATFVFASSGAEAINHVIFATYFDVTRKTGKNHYLTSSLEEAPIIMAQNRLNELGCSFHMVPASSQGIITPDAVAQSITPRTALLSLSMGNGLIGTVNPVAEIIAICKERGILVHLDISHILGKIDFSLKEIEADFLTFSGDLIHGPRASGGLFIKGGHPLTPLIVGGNEQGGRRGGHFNMAAFAGLATASRKMGETKDTLCTEVARLRDRFEKGIIEQVTGAKVHFQNELRLPHISAIGFPHVFNEALAFLLNKKKVFASFGGGSSQQVAHILRATGTSSYEAERTLSFAFSFETREEEVDEAVGRIVKTALHLQKCGKYIPL